MTALSLENGLSPPRPFTPYVNYCLITLIFLVYAWELSLGTNLLKATEYWGFVPARLTGFRLHPPAVFLQGLVNLFSSLFLHGNSLHLITNGLFLFIFGNKVEDLLGHGRYLILYLVAGVGANLVYLLSAPFSTFSIIGASGAIAAVMAGYFSLFPRQRFTTLFIIAWVLLQFLDGIHESISRLAAATGTAWWAHVGGFLLGLALVRFLAPAGVWLIPVSDGRQTSSQD